MKYAASSALFFALIASAVTAFSDQTDVNGGVFSIMLYGRESLSTSAAFLFDGVKSGDLGLSDGPFC
jgi:hypothetical protein